MNKHQTQRLNFILMFPWFWLGVLFSVSGADTKSELAKADSLFQRHKYTEALAVYQQILTQEKVASTQMLMRMAYVQEGLGEYEQALYHLNQYYEQTADERAQYKMKELAQTHQLKGYDLSDTTFFRSMISKHYLLLHVLVFVIALLLGAAAFYRKFRRRGRATLYAVALVVWLMTFFWLSNGVLNVSKAIITTDHTYLMAGPSAGADLIAVVSKGHRVSTLSHDGAWVKIDWAGQLAYIRPASIQKVN